jgi:hypothetical protein
MSDPETRRAHSLHAAERDEGEGAPGFRVIDRRRFTADGSERDDAAEEPQPAAAPPPPSAAGAPAGPDAAQDAGPELATPTGEPYEERPSAPFEPSFGTLLISLSTQALMHLGEIPDLEGGDAGRDLAAARHIIDLIAVLERKTAGNLDADEAALLERILYDLRMRFVAISRG